MAEDRNVPVTKNDLKRMMEQVLRQANENTSKILNDKIPQPKSEKRQKLDKVKLKSSSNQAQLDFHQQVVDIFEQAENNLEHQKYVEAKTLIEEGYVIIE